MDIHTIQDTLPVTFQVGRYAFSPEDVRQCSAGHGDPRQEPPPTPPHTYSDNTATAGATVSNEQLMALFEKPATAKRFVDTCYSSLFYKRTPRHVRNPLSFQVSPRAKQYQTKSPARSANSPCKQSPSKTRRSPKGGGALTNGRHRRHLADARHGHAVVDFSRIFFTDPVKKRK